MSEVSITTKIPQRLDRLPWSRWHSMIVVALGITWILDGLEVTIVGAIGPVLTNPGTLNFTEEQVGLTATAYLIGTVCGALLFSYLTDKQGRKRWFMVTLYVYLVATLLSACSWNLWSFMIFRFIAGMGIGGEYSAINSAIDELIPSRSRGHVDIAINGSWWIGTLIGAIISVPLLNVLLLPVDVGWRVCFALGAVLGLAILLIRRFVPESPRWLMVNGRHQEAEDMLDQVEEVIKKEHKLQVLEEPLGQITIKPKQKITFITTINQLINVYPKRTILGLALMITQACLYNAIFFTYAMVLNKFYAVPNQKIGFYIIPFAIANFCGPLILGRFFDTVGRRIMISSTYIISGLLLAATSLLFLNNSLDAVTQTICWSVVFFFASAGASSAYLTVSEVFPLEIRAMAIAVFFVVAQGTASLTPWIFGILIQESRWGLSMGNLAAAFSMVIGGIIAYIYGVNAERRALEDIAAPLSSDS